MSSEDPEEVVPEFEEDPRPPDLSIAYSNRSDPFLVVCCCFNILTSISAFLCVVVNIFSAVHSFRRGEDIFGGVLRCYAVVIALFVAIAETEWGWILKFWTVDLDFEVVGRPRDGTSLGILCIGHLKQARLSRSLNRNQLAKDLEDLERRKKELERLLSRPG